MKAEDTIVNRVEKSGLLTIDLQDYLTDTQTRVIDFKDYLFQGLVLKEKDFRHIKGKGEAKYFTSETNTANFKSNGVFMKALIFDFFLLTRTSGSLTLL